MKELKINHLAVLASVVLLFVLGFLWYGPVFGEQWMGMVGLDRATIEANPPGAGIWVTNVVSAIVSMYALAWLFTRLNVQSAMDGAKYALIIGVAFVLLSTMTTNMFAQRPYGLAWITGGNTTVGLVIGGIILGAWRKYKE
ncbi:MAG: DUF1761 domain-containing protein [Bacteroidetes bacterium]|nr:MAG: DUF1761 domain-containing protein [Bacteroidota bacterium]